MNIRRLGIWLAYIFLGFSGLQILTWVLSILGWLPTFVDWITGAPSGWIALATFVPLVIGSLILWGLKQSVELKPDLPLEDAFALIMRMKKWSSKTEDDIQKELWDMACDSRLTVWGQPEIGHALLPASDTLVKIPYHFFYDVAGARFEDRGFMLKRFSDHPNSNEQTRFRRVYQVTLCKAEALKQFLAL